MNLGYKIRNPNSRKTIRFVFKGIRYHFFLGLDGQEAIWLILNGEAREKLDPATRRIGPANIPYCNVREGIFEARFSRNAYQLAPYIHHEEQENRFFLSLNKTKYPL